MAQIGTLLVTGATGFLGGRLKDVAVENGISVIATGRAVPSDKRSRFVQADLADAGQVLAMLNETRPTHIVNCAAFVDFTGGFCRDMFAVNALAPAIMSDWCARNDAYMLQVSGTLVHGVRTRQISEETPIAPDTAYGSSKLLAEQAVEQSCAKALRLRVGGIFGIDGPDHLFLNRVLRGARDGRPPTIVGEGRALRNYIHVDDLVEVLLDAARAEKAGLGMVGGQQSLSIAEMMAIVCDIWLPGVSPERIAGDEADDQLIYSSDWVKGSRSFRESVEAEKARVAGL